MPREIEVTKNPHFAQILDAGCVVCEVSREGPELVKELAERYPENRELAGIVEESLERKPNDVQQKSLRDRATLYPTEREILDRMATTCDGCLEKGIQESDSVITSRYSCLWRVGHQI